ncbi:MAG TPA: LptF/LptG family permease [Vicinamibacterales bacterium]|nr:LptF/LptG family permease [Vicinamibacterales bacterium]
MSILDRYVLRLILPPFLIALGVFTFVLAVEPILDRAKDLLAKGVSVPTAAWLLSCLLPSALALTIPMALLTGILIALGRLSGDRESVALVACGVSPFRLLRPLLAVAVLAGGLDLYILVKAVPDANQTFNDIAFRTLTEQTAADIKPRVFYDRFPGKVLYIRDILPNGRWAGVLVADSRDPQRPSVTLADEGELVIDREHRAVEMILRRQNTYAPGRTDPRVYLTSSNEDLKTTISADSVFGNARTVPGLHDMTRAQLADRIEQHRLRGEPAHQEIIQRQQMFSFPVACLVFAVIGLGVGLNTRKEGRLAGLTLGLGIIMLYYATMGLAEAWAKSAARTANAADLMAGGRVDIIAGWARWIPNILVGLIGLLALWRQARPNGLNLPIRAPRWWTEWRARMAARTPRRGSLVSLPGLPRWVPLPRLLDRYVGHAFMRAGALAFLGLLALYYIGAFVDLADKIKRPGDGEIFFNFLINSTPQFLIFVIPVATLMAALGAIGGLTRSGELIVMRACGVSLYRASAPLLVFALALSGVLLLVEERVLGEANRTASTLRNQFRDEQPGEIPAGIAFQHHRWLVGDDGRVYHYALFTPADPGNGGRPTIQDLSVFDVASRPYRLTAHLYAAHARFDGRAWRLDRGWSQEFTRDAAVRRDFENQTITLANITEFQNANVDPDTMTYFAARAYVARLGASGFNVTEERVNLHRRLAFPLVTVVMTLLAIPFGVTIGRKGALYGIGLATILAGSYFLLMTFFVAFGSAGLLPPMLAAWGANILFAAGATYMILTVRT